MTRADFFIGSAASISVDIDFIVRSNLLLELNELFDITSTVNSQEGVKLFQESFSLSEIIAFLVFNLNSQKFNKRKSDLIVLKTFNKIVILHTSFSQNLGNMVLVFLDSLDKPLNVILSVLEFSLMSIQHIMQVVAFSLFVREFFFNSSNVSFKNRFLDSPVSFDISNILLSLI